MSTKLLKRALNLAGESPSAPSSSGQPQPPRHKKQNKRQIAKIKKKQDAERAAVQHSQLTQQRNLRYFSSQAPNSAKECMTQVGMHMYIDVHASMYVRVGQHASTREPANAWPMHADVLIMCYTPSAEALISEFGCIVHKQAFKKARSGKK